MSERECKSYRRGKDFCRDGFPQNSTCAGIVGGLPCCMKENLCARLYPETGAPPERMIELGNAP